MVILEGWVVLKSEVPLRMGHLVDRPVSGPLRAVHVSRHKWGTIILLLALFGLSRAPHYICGDVDGRIIVPEILF